MAFQWGTALGAGAKAALNTYETLEDIDLKRAEDARRERELKIREEQNARSAATHARLERAAEKAEADARRIQAIYAGYDVNDLEGAAASGATASGAPAVPARSAALDVPDTPTAGVQTRQALPTGGVDAQAPRENIQPAQTQPRGRPSLSQIRDRLLRAGFVGEAEKVGRIMDQDALREIRQIERAKSALELNAAQIDFARNQMSQRVASVSHMMSGLTEDDNDALNTGMESPVRTIVKEMQDAYKLLPDGRKLDADFNEDGSVTLKFTDEDSGKVVSEQKLTTYGQLRRAIGMYGSVADPVTYNQYLLFAQNQRREAELANIKLTGEKAKTAESLAKAQNAEAETAIRRQINDLMRDPAANEDQLLYLADLLAVYDPKALETKKIADPATGEERTVTVNKYLELVRGMLPKESVQTVDANGRTVTDTTQGAVQDYLAILPELIQQSGGRVDVALAQLRRRHDRIFNRGAFDKYALPLLQPRLQALLRQGQQAQQAAQQGAQQNVGALPNPYGLPPEQLEKLRQQREESARETARRQAIKDERGAPRPRRRYTFDTLGLPQR